MNYIDVLQALHKQERMDWDHIGLLSLECQCVIATPMDLSLWHVWPSKFNISDSLLKHLFTLFEKMYATKQINVKSHVFEFWKTLKNVQKT